MASEPTTMRISAWRNRSELTTAPMVVRLACDSMGPSFASRAVTISPSFPSVGSCVLPTGPADGEADGDADPDGAAAPDGDTDGATVGTGSGCNPIGSVLISMNPVPVRIATAS